MKDKKGLSSKDELMCLNENDRFEFIESFKTLRTNLTFGLAQREHKRILVTSSLPSEGKTTTTVSMAMAFAQTGAKVLLVDADMRNPKIHRYFKRKNDVGLSAVLSGIASLDDCVTETECENLFLLKSGQLPPNPAELLEGRFIEAVFEEMDKKFNYIIFDTPPMNVVSDALSISRLNTSILFVVRENQSTHEELKRSLRSIELAEVDLIGVVLNDSKSDRRYGYYKRGKYGRYGYGYGTKRSKTRNSSADMD